MRTAKQYNHSISTGESGASGISGDGGDVMHSTYLLWSDDVPRPCYYMFRVLGTWQPRNCLWILRLYNHASYVIWLASLAAVVAFGYLHVHTFRWEEFLNTCGSCLDLGCPFIFTKYYFSRGVFDALLVHVMKFSASASKSITKLSKIYTALSTFLWVICFAFFYAHWSPFFYRWWHYLVYSVALFYACGFWASWLSLYGFVCHVHRIQVMNFRKEMRDLLSHTNVELEEDKQHVTNLFMKFHELEDWLNRSQANFSMIISFSVAYHIGGMCAFSVAYWSHVYGRDYPIWQYAGGMLFDLLSILIKLYPAAVLCQALHDTMVSAGGLCLSGSLRNIPYDRINFYQFLYLRDQDIGFRILGVKITSKLTVGIFVTIATAAATFLRYSIVNM